MVFKKVVKKTSPVIVETKKHEEVSCCNNGWKKCFGKVFIVVLLLLNLAIWVLNYFKSTSARDIEALKVWGNDNLQLVKKLYEMDTYKEQQKGAIMQVLNSFVSGPKWQQALPTQQNPQQLPTEAQAPAEAQVITQ